MAENVVDYNQVKAFTTDPKVLIIDVREPNELKSTGVIDGSINIPTAELESSLKLSNDEFKAKYNKEKPDLEFPLVFSCKMGGRAKRSLDLAISLGYKNVSYYKGSWTDWEQNQKAN